MSEQVKLVKEVYGRNTYVRVVDTSFSELYSPVTASVQPGINTSVELFLMLTMNYSFKYLLPEN